MVSKGSVHNKHLVLADVLLGLGIGGFFFLIWGAIMFIAGWLIRRSKQEVWNG